MEYSFFVVPFPRKKLKGFSSLTVPESSLKVPAKSDQIFIAAHTYLMKGDYLPELGSSPYQNAAGPPIIAHFRNEAVACLLTDVRVFALAGKMSFMELKHRALQRMYSMAMIQEDPMTALEEIYKEHELNGEDKYLLREWCRDFLRKLNPEIGINLVILDVRPNDGPTPTSNHPIPPGPRNVRGATMAESSIVRGSRPRRRRESRRSCARRAT